MVDYACTSCTYKGPRRKVMSGSKLHSFMWWFIVPTIWELFSDGVPNFSGDPMEMLEHMQASSSGGGVVQELIVSCIPGAIYSIWRRVKKAYVCPVCNSKVMVPVLRDGSAVSDEDVSKKSHVLEIEKAVAEMERKLAETKKSQEVAVVSPAVKQEVVAKPAVQAQPFVVKQPEPAQNIIIKQEGANPVNEAAAQDVPAGKNENMERSKNEW